ncbi:uncharacterized protein LOC109897639 [Oncorhynchus kisutch]|uniref:uncharacterized protein LOC109897639 n=1 Tax=Oncorhynchus kisutch TaxID=8019 RepID=UPI0012DF69BF|nr:uncharacterized protein LOC109897639 [Oncorhynchus kisutch]
MSVSDQGKKWAYVVLAAWISVKQTCSKSAAQLELSLHGMGGLVLLGYREATEPSPPKPEELGVVIIQGGLSSLEVGDTEAQEGPGVEEDMVTEAREAMVLVWEQEMAKEWGREPGWAHRVGNHVEVEDTVVMAMAHSQVTGLELEPEAIHDQVLELGIPMDRDLRDQNRGMLQELEEFPLDRVLNHPNRDMVQELECPMDRVLSPMATVLEQAATLGQETTAMEQVPVWDREDTPRVEQVDTPRVEQENKAKLAVVLIWDREDTPRVEQEDTPRVQQEDTPRVEQEDTPRVEQVDTPRVQQEDTPRVEQEDTPRVEQVDTPRVEQEDTPRVEQEDTPRVEQVDTPRVEQEDTPRVEQVDTPRVEQENKAKLAVVLIWDREDIPRVEQEDTPRVEQANQQVMVIKWEEHTPGLERATAMGMVEAQLVGPMQCLQAMAMATVLVLEAMVMDPVLAQEDIHRDRRNMGEESVSFLTMEPQSILLDWMVMEASLMVLSNWALVVVMEANPLANMETEGALEHSQQAMVKDSWVQVRVPPTVTEQEGRKANMVVVD